VWFPEKTADMAGDFTALQKYNTFVT
jgi:hypothetical protein